MSDYNPIRAYELWLDSENQKVKPKWQHAIDEANLDLLLSGDITVEFRDGEPYFTITEQGKVRAYEAKAR